MNTAEIRQKATDTIRFYEELGEELFKVKMPHINLDFSLRGQCGGAYGTSTHTIRLNMVLMTENFTEYIEQVIPHEVAHAFQKVVYGHLYSYGRVTPHGKEWKRIMRSFGKSPDRCHQMDTTNAQVRTVKAGYKYRCNCKTWDLTVIRHRRSMKGSAYRCNKCHGVLKFVGEGIESSIAA